MGALEISRRARKDGKRSADAADRSATAAEQTLADQRREAAERRAAEEEAARPKAQLFISFVGGHRYRIRNRGDATAVDVTNTNPCGAVDAWPENLNLRPGEAHDFMIAGDMENLAPAQIAVTWEGQAEPVILPVP
ncbi:hypothetical protein HW445_07835 [Streptomyces sp. UH6]|nr:hypothetical protein [Streptomyces sp. UH6]